MTEETNIQAFNKFIVVLLNQLYNQFPIKKKSMLEDFDHLNNKKDADIFFSSIEFLKNENYIRFDRKIYGGFKGVVLTGKGLDILNSTPVSISKSMNVASLIKDCIKNGSKEAIKTASNEIIKLGASYISKKIKEE